MVLQADHHPPFRVMVPQADHPRLFSAGHPEPVLGRASPDPWASHDTTGMGLPIGVIVSQQILRSIGKRAGLAWPLRANQ
jgi:hypothetical protein